MMSIALESGTNRIEGSGFIRGLSCISIFQSPESGRPIAGIMTGDQRFPITDLAANVVEREEELDSSSSSSIGRNSDLSGRSSTASDGEDETEVQSLYKEPLNSMDALEEVLPIRRGISNFYCGKSRSFSSLADVSSPSSIKDLAKPENAYTRKRKNLLASSIWVQNQNSPLRSNVGGVSKRPTNSSRSAHTLTSAMNISESNNTSKNSNTISPSSSWLLPPLPPQAKPSFNDASSLSLPQQNFSKWRSFSLTDLQGVTSTTNSTNTLSISNRD